MELKILHEMLKDVKMYEFFLLVEVFCDCFLMQAQLLKRLLRPVRVNPNLLRLGTCPVFMGFKGRFV